MNVLDSYITTLESACFQRNAAPCQAHRHLCKLPHPTETGRIRSRLKREHVGKQIARSLATGRLLASPPLSSDASTPGGGRGEVDKFSPSGSRHGEERDTQSSDKDSYSTGESDTENDAEEVRHSAHDFIISRSTPPSLVSTANSLRYGRGETCSFCAVVIRCSHEFGSVPPLHAREHHMLRRRVHRAQSAHRRRTSEVLFTSNVTIDVRGCTAESQLETLILPTT